MNEKLELLSMAEQFRIEKKEYGYEISHREENVSALISSDNTINYFVDGVYNSGTDWAQIDMDALMELKKFCEMMIK